MDESDEPTDAEVEATIAEFGGDPRAAIRALLHDLAALALDRALTVSRGYVRGRKGIIVALATDEGLIIMLSLHFDARKPLLCLEWTSVGSIYAIRERRARAPTCGTQRESERIHEAKQMMMTSPRILYLSTDRCLPLTLPTAPDRQRTCRMGACSRRKSGAKRFQLTGGQPTIGKALLPTN